MTASVTSLAAARAANATALDELECLENDVWELVIARDWKRALHIVESIRTYQPPPCATPLVREKCGFVASAFAAEIRQLMSETNGGAA